MRVGKKEGRNTAVKCNFITIEREYGSGGTKIARKLSEICGVPCYGREILEEVSRKYGYSLDKIEKYEETVTNSFLYSVFLMGRMQAGETDMLAGEGHMYLAEQDVVKNLASNGRAIFLGHCASEALKSIDGVVKVFIHAQAKEKRIRIASDYGIPESDIDMVRRRFDKKRANYYYANTSRKWDDMKNYDIVLDSTDIGINGCVDVLKGLFEKKE